MLGFFSAVMEELHPYDHTGCCERLKCRCAPKDVENYVCGGKVCKDLAQEIPKLYVAGCIHREDLPSLDLLLRSSLSTRPSLLLDRE